MIEIRDKKVLIITHTATEANFYARQYGWETWEFVSSIATLNLQKDVVIVYVGNWAFRNDLNRLNEIVDEMVKENKAYIPMNPAMRRHEIHMGIQPEPILYNNERAISLMKRQQYLKSRKRKI